MCIIHLFPAGIEVNWEGLINGSYINDDGHGWAIASSDGLEVGKSMDFNTAANDLEKSLDHHAADRIVMFHSRFGTHGVMGEENVHPFYTDESGLTVMSHNGILPGLYHPTKWDRRSDTRIFVDRVVPHYLNDDHGVPSRRGAQALGAMIGTANKLVFLSVKSGRPKARLINASCGVQEGGAWYSNDGFRDTWVPTWKTAGWQERDYWEPSPGKHTELTVSANGRDLVHTGREWEDVTMCEHCKAIGEINWTIGMCMACESCVECGLLPNECDCYVVASAMARAKAEHEQLALPAGESA